MYVAQPEVANLWLQVLTDINNRGVKDILITCVDGLTGFPDTDVQLCVVHQIRNSTQGDKDQGRVPFGPHSSQTCVSCISYHQQEVDFAAAKLGIGRATIVNHFRRKISIFLITLRRRLFHSFICRVPDK